MAYKDGASYVPIACITSRSESNATNTSEKVNVCTEGKTVTTATGVTRMFHCPVRLLERVLLEALRILQKSLAEQIFRVYRGRANRGVIFQRHDLLVYRLNILQAKMKMRYSQWISLSTEIIRTQMFLYKITLNK